MSEAKIQIGDHVLTEAQSMAVRVAITTFAMELTPSEDDEPHELREGIGEALADAYWARLNEVLRIMVEHGGLK